MAELMERLGPALPVRYRLVREIGRGGAARVFLAHELHPHREVAIKVLEPAIAAMVGSERFLREVDFASKLAHPHILPVFAAGEADGLLYYVMPYVPGDTLRDRLAAEHVLPLDQAVHIAREVADALAYAHERGVVHRDIKPENILLQSGHAVVADFGIARAIAATDRGPLTESGFVVGTPAYMSPEQAAGGGQIDGRSDVYSLGCVLYEMLTGETPHTGAPDAVIAKKLHSPVPPVSLLRPTVSAGVATAVAIALARTPADRYETATRFREALGAALAAGSVVAGATPLGTTAPADRIQSPLATTEARPAARAGLPAALSSRTGLTLLLAAVAAVNWLETALDNRVGARSSMVAEARHQVAHAMKWLEGGVSFAGHDVTNDVALYGYASAYFFLFPALLAAIAVTLARRPTIRAYRLLVTATTLDYALSLPFYLLLPTPERWSFPESDAVMLSDRWTSGLIEAARPISGLDNCFPSFHVSLTVILVLACFVWRLRYRWSALACGMTVLLSTFALGIHWVADIVAGIAVGLISFTVALRLERRWSVPHGSAAFTLRRVALLLAVGWLVAPAASSAQTPVTFVAVALDADSRRADDKLRRYLETTAGVAFVAEQAQDYRTVIDRLVTWRPERGGYVARVTPYALVAAELLGADVQVLATYVSRATGGTTYRSYLVLNRARFPRDPDLAQVPALLRAAASPPTFAYHSEFSTSSYFLPAIYFRRNDIFDMPASAEHVTAIRARQVAGNADDLVKAVALGQYDLAAVWSGTKAAFEQTDSLAARYGRLVSFVELPTTLPNDLLVASGSLDSATVGRIHRAIREMSPTQIAEGDFLTWLEINDSLDAREALANLRWLAREPPAPAAVDVRRATFRGRIVPDEYLAAARQAIRLAGLELVNYDRDYHAQQDYVWTLQPMHDGAVRLHSRIVGADADDQEFPISFRDVEELTGRIGELLHSRLHRVRYLWPYRTDPPTVLRDVAFSLMPGDHVPVQTVRWLDTQRHSYLQDAQFNATVARSDFYKLELSPSFVRPPDQAGFSFNPMSNISYRVVLVRQTHERPVFRALAAGLVLLLVLAAAAAAVELRRLLRTTDPAREP